MCRQRVDVRRCLAVPCVRETGHPVGALTPHRLQGREKIERFFRTVCEQLLVEVGDTTAEELAAAGTDHRTAPHRWNSASCWPDGSMPNTTRTLIEHPNVWLDRLPKAGRELRPEIVATDDRRQVWTYRGTAYPNVGLNAVVCGRVIGSRSKRAYQTLYVYSVYKRETEASGEEVSDHETPSSWVISHRPLAFGRCTAQGARSVPRRHGCWTNSNSSTTYF